MHGTQTKSVAAYDGARFNVGGFCISHSDVRLCRLGTDGKYKTVRKICPKCGNAPLMTKGNKSKLHGHRKNSMSCRVEPIDSKIGGVNSCSNGDRHGKKAGLRNSQGPHQAKAERRGNQNPHARSLSHRAAVPTRKEDIQRRGRTLSPLRKNLQSSPSKPSSDSSASKKKVTNGKIRELMKLQLPFYNNSSNKSDSSGRDGQPSSLRGSQNSKSRQSLKPKRPFDASGHCMAHPEVQLAKKNTKGQWEIVSGVCPQCCVSAVLACQPSKPQENPMPVKSNTVAPSETEPNDDPAELIGKVLKTKRSEGTQSSRDKGYNDSNLRQSMKQKLIFDANGHCVAHPEVQLAEKTPEGQWEVICVVCPQCGTSEVIACKQNQNPQSSKSNLAAANTHRIQKHLTAVDDPQHNKSMKAAANTKGSRNLPTCEQKEPSKTENSMPTKSNKAGANTKDSGNDSDQLIGKVLKTKTCDISLQTQLTSPSSSYPSTPESVSKPAFSTDYFTSANRNIIGLALDIYQGEKMVAELNEPSESGATMKHKSYMNATSNKPCVPPPSKDTGPINTTKLFYPPPRKEPPGRRMRTRKK